MMNEIEKLALAAQKASRVLAVSDTQTRNKAVAAIADAATIVAMKLGSVEMVL